MPLSLTTALGALACLLASMSLASGQTYPRVWSQSFPATHPPQEESYAMAYDEARRVTVLFGGFDGESWGIFAGTWLWDGRNWSMATLLGPGPRYAPFMVYDTRRQVCVLFGGSPPGEEGRAETWEWDGATWLLRATNGPPQRELHAMAYDQRRARVVMFGGRTCGLCGAVDGITWEWDGEQWSLVSETGPGRRLGAAMAYDELQQRVIMFGGHDEGTRQVYNDTWAWDGESWSQLATGGPGGWRHAMAYDRRRGSIVLFGGFGDNSAQTWEWNGASWARRFLSPSPSARVDHGMVYDAQRDELLLYGGSIEGTAHDTWRLHLAETWVDFGSLGFPSVFEFGTFEFPYNTLAEGVAAALPGTIVQIKSSSTGEAIHIDKPLFLRAWGGPATVGRIGP